MNDLTILYYTCNHVEEPFATNIRKHLLSIMPKDTPIISISHKPIDFGKNICVAGFEVSIYNVYKQILISSREVETRFLACCEDDSIYCPEHFEHRPEDDSFDYNSNRWQIDKDFYFWRPRAGMHTCIAPTKLMVETLEKRFEKYPTLLPREQLAGFCEPGRRERRIGLPWVKMTTFKTSIPVLVFNRFGGLGGKRRVKDTDLIVKDHEYWGSAADLWRKFHYD